MSRVSTNGISRGIFGARFSKQFQKGKKKGRWSSQKDFGQQLKPPASRSSVANWCKGDDFPTPERLKQICEIFGVNEDYFNTENATRAELYEYASEYVTEIGIENSLFSEEIGLNLDLVYGLSQIVDFDKLFPLYAPIWQFKTDPNDPFHRIYNRNVTHANSAPIDKSLEFFQIDREGKKITLSKPDLAYLKEVQDKIVEYVEFLFFNRTKEMKEEEKRFNEDQTVKLKNGGTATRKIDRKFLNDHDRFLKYILQEEEGES